MAQLPEVYSLGELQRYVQEVEKERGFDEESALQKCLLLGEEVGELFKAVRRASALKTDPASEVRDVGEELSDVLNYILAIANRFNIDLSEQYARKESINRTRSWS